MKYYKFLVFAATIFGIKKAACLEEMYILLKVNNKLICFRYLLVWSLEVGK